MRIKLLLSFLVLFTLAMPVVFAESITLKYTPASSPNGFQAFWDIDFIIIYDIDTLTQEELTQLLIHEYTHQLCYSLFGVYSNNIYEHDPRCFTGKGYLLID